MEAYAAAVKYDIAVQELQAVETQIKNAKSEWEAIKNCEFRFEDVIKQKSDWIKAQGIPEAEELLVLENKQNEAQSQITETKEAITVGKSVISAISYIKDALDNADSLAIWDISGGGVFADIAKYDELKEAEEQIVALQKKLRRFKTELVDVDIVADIYVDISEWTQFIDIFYDNIFTDWKVREHITNTKNQLLGVGEQVSNVLTRLQNLLEQRQAESKQLQESMDVLVLNVHE